MFFFAILSESWIILNYLLPADTRCQSIQRIHGKSIIFLKKCMEYSLKYSKIFFKRALVQVISINLTEIW